MCASAVFDSVFVPFLRYKDGRVGQSLQLSFKVFVWENVGINELNVGVVVVDNVPEPDVDSTSEL